MLTLGSLSFLAPWALAGLAVLPALWWLLRATPPRPRQVRFPAIAFLFGLSPTDEAAVRMPIWLLLLRMVLAAAVILAIANPVIGALSGEGSEGPLVVIVDDGWSSAADWDRRQSALVQRLEEAAARNRPAAILSTSGTDPVRSLEEAGAVLARARTLEPKPWSPDRGAATERLRELREILGAASGTPNILWLTDGLVHDESAFRGFTETLRSLGPLEILRPDAERLPIYLGAPAVDGRGISVEIRRASPNTPSSGRVRAVGPQGRLVASAPFAFESEAQTARAQLDLPLALTNTVSRLEIESASSAGAVFLMDGRWRRRHVGIGAPDGREGEQPLLEAQTYLERAMTPFAEVESAPIGGLLDRGVQMIVLADVGQIVGGLAGRLSAWVNQGGLLLRFAGPRLANQDDTLVPVPLRRGGRTLGGALDWSEPQRLAPFPEESPFAGLPIPEDVRVTRQVLAEPGSALAGTVWARLEDGTPLVTARRQGDGLLVLIHVTATPNWSSLALSGLFVEMLERIAALAPAGGEGPAQTRAEATASVLQPALTLNGRGELGEPPTSALPIRAEEIASVVPGPTAPPGLYGRGADRAALNVSGESLSPTPITAWPASARVSGYAAREVRALAPALYGLALLLFAADLIAMLVLQGRLPRFGRAAAAGSLAIALSAGVPIETAQADTRALEATLDTRLGYVRTGNARSDAIARAGLEGLTREIVRRTAVEAAEPLEVDLERDELAFFPVLYWRIAPSQPPLSEEALGRLDSYLKGGGTILFDTADLPEALPRPEHGFEALGPGSIRLRRTLKRLDVPALMPIPENHILTRSFFLLRDLPGRWTGGDVWVELASADTSADPAAERAPTNLDGVSSVVIGAHDWAGAWAKDDGGAPLSPAVPGGERQREMAYRFGINLVMYALTGNYKADQVHIPAILERLGQ